MINLFPLLQKNVGVNEFPLYISKVFHVQNIGHIYKMIIVKRKEVTIMTIKTSATTVMMIVSDTSGVQ